ncbi:MAG: monofunctional biosynthetic peptidoglycan transglycosylase [Syntrophobacterales bacterium CG_4_8_14_3_um_filter_58_8]|nr:MAG: monofunctional biosynthetic peptidoglycan transglycosylase [Syntrophaceae bacterium CG2_30_58_14]PIV00075.1 MAG: monofunctional biosynthetic peptidoglycan transglycosylase [Syntrophobacterales bacterium CG03_land_8_20_14_0_80_58_14]PJC71542.1 MAG: monofunctional biosynthetic peptidoglycan transglycosylase [Syntrophobacterales bacterium CG_4_8_14_3_um_filter_58_8]
MWKKWTRRAAILLAAAFLLNIAFYLVYPDVSRLKRERPVKTAFMIYREGQWRKAGLQRRIRQEWAPLSRISPYAIKAVIIAEDDKFWSHEGFDFGAIQKAIEKDLQKRRFKAGGSTISQQLVKNLYLTPAKNPVRKLKEAVVTWRLERSLSKRRIIELYLNVAEWGEGIFGIEAAARHYFGKGADALTAREAAALAVVLPAPLRYHPVEGGRYVESRTEAVYRIMVRRGIVIPEYEELLNEPPGTRTPPQTTGDAGKSDVPEGTDGRAIGMETPPEVGGAEGEKGRQPPAD